MPDSGRAPYPGFLRPAVATDLVTVASWITSARDCELWTGWRVGFPIDMSTLPASLGITDQNTYAWIVDGRIACFGQIVGKSVERAHLASIIVAPSARRQGHGRRFVCALLAHVAQGTLWISLNVDEQNAGAVALYEGLGFVDAPRPPDEPPASGSRYLVRRLTDT
jgi:ribosomal protein S18 acetylase RimI-like enzyme